MKKILKNLKKKNINFFLLLILIIFVGSYLRLYKLNQTPPGIEKQEASLGLEAIKISEINHDFSSFFKKENLTNLYPATLAFSINSLGTEISSLRLASSIFGILTLIGFSLLLLKLKFSRLSTLLGVFILGTSFWHLNFSRMVDSSILTPFFIIWFFYLFILGIKKQNTLFFILSGILLGISFYFSLKFCLLLLILFILILFFIFFQKDFTKNYWKKLILFVMTFLLITTPLIYLSYQNPEISPNRKELLNSINYKNFSDNIILHLNAFYFQGDSNQKYNHAGTPLIPSTWTILFTIGFALSVKEIIYCFIHRKQTSFSDPLFKISVLSQAIFWIMLLPGILIKEGLPDSSKIIGTIPAIIIFILIPFEYILRLRENLQKSTNFKLKPWRWKILNSSLGILILFVSLAGAINTYTYFFVWNNQIQTVEVYEKELVDFGKIIKKQTIVKNNIAIVPDKFKLDENNQNLSIKTIEFSGYPKIRAFKFKNPLETLENLKENKECQNSTYLFLEANTWLIDEFKAICPNIESEKQKPLDGYYEFWVLKN
jgi:hypothetical protein